MAEPRTEARSRTLSTLRASCGRAFAQPLRGREQAPGSDPSWRLVASIDTASRELSPVCARLHPNAIANRLRMPVDDRRHLAADVADYMRQVAII